MNKKIALKEFKENITHIYDPDFGDFKRKFGNYISRLAPHFIEDDSAFEILKDIKHYIAFDDNTRNPEDVKFYVEQKLSQLEEHLEVTTHPPST